MTDEYSIEAAKASADEAIERIDGATNDRWKRTARRAVRYLVNHLREGFTTDDVWNLLDDADCEVHDRRALGPVMRSLQGENVISPSGEYRPSIRRNCAPLRVWIQPGCVYPGPLVDDDELITRLRQVQLDLIELSDPKLNGCIADLVMAINDLEART